MIQTVHFFPTAEKRFCFMSFLAKQIIFFLICVVFFLGCSHSDEPKDIQPLASQEENPEDIISRTDKKPLPVSIQKEQFLNHLQGIYRGTYQTDHFEVWIEKIGQSEDGEPVIAVLLFLQEKKQDIQQFLTKYQDVNSYYEDICESFNRPLRANTNINLFEISGAKRIWNSIGVLGKIHMEMESFQKFYFFEKTRFFIKFQDQQYGFKFLSVSDSGKAQSIKLFNERFVQRITTLIPIKIQLVKTSDSKTGLLNKYYQNIKLVKQRLQEERDKNYTHYCSDFFIHQNH